jgi:AcrR family transcriptional regulator
MAARAHPAPKPSRNRLNRERILDVAEHIAATEGIQALTMRRLGEALQADHTAVYRHFRNKDELLFGVADRLFGIGPELDLSKGWRQALREQIEYGLSRYRVHPELAQLMAAQPDTTENLIRLIDRGLEALQSAGLSLEEASRLYFVIENHVVGTGLYYSLVDHSKDLRLIDPAVVRRIYAGLPAGQFPRASAAAPYLFPDPEETFQLATELLLDSIERWIEETKASRTASQRR